MICLTTKLIAVFDKYKIGSKDVVHLLMATEEALDQDISELVGLINSNSIHHYCETLRAYHVARPRVRKSRYSGETLRFPIHCCDVTKLPYLFSGEL